MSDRILYIQRTDRGDRLAALSLIGPRTCDTWQAGDTSTVDAALAAVRAGAAWVRERLSASERHTLTTVCLDPDGSICSWLSAPSDDPAIIAAVARGVTAGGHEGEHDTDHLGGGPAPAARALDHFATVGAGMSLQSLTTLAPADNGHDDSPRRAKAAADAAARRRLAVLGVPDSVAGLLLDELDAGGVAAPPAISLWHAIARAWDPSSPGNARSDAPRADRLVADVAPVTAIVIIEPHGRLTWAWSRAGTLLTGGSMRLPRARTAAPQATGSDAARLADPAHTPRLDASQGARLAAEWLSWSAQTGAAPGRVVLLTPERTAGLSPAEFAGALVKAWPGAMIDVLSHDDPVVHTLQRAMDDDAPVDPAASITALTTRPTRAHRSMYVWLALAITGASAAAIVAAIMSWRTAADARQRASDIRAKTREEVFNHYEGDATRYVAGMLLTLQDDLTQMQTAQAPAPETQFMPIMQELENISLAVSSLTASHPECDLRSMRVDTLTGVQLTVRFPGTSPADLAIFENFRNMLREIGPSRLSWSDSGLSNQPGRPQGPPGVPQGGPQAPAGAESTFRGTWLVNRPGGGQP